ncbi:MAG: helix-turn-helix transcriptional regulator [Anaerolineae bacterium]|nr:helix-turn-helix transcriptional regulator [Anaerolineae bacterium]
MHNRWKQCNGRGCNRRMGQSLDPALLLLLKQAPAHGYTLLGRLAEFKLDFLAPTVVYRALREMELQGWVASTWDEEETHGPPRRIYSLTPLGNEVLRCCAAQLRDAQQITEYILALYDELAAQNATDVAYPIDGEVAMKIAIPADGADLDAPASSVFGRCQTFIFVDPQSLNFEVLPNPAQNASGGAGVQAAQMVVQHGANAVIAPQLGPNAFRVLDAAGIRAYTLIGATMRANVRDVVAAFNAGQLAPLETPGENHAGHGKHRGE